MQAPCTPAHRFPIPAGYTSPEGEAAIRALARQHHARLAAKRAWRDRVARIAADMEAARQPFQGVQP